MSHRQSDGCVVPEKRVMPGEESAVSYHDQPEEVPGEAPGNERLAETCEEHPCQRSDGRR